MPQRKDEQIAELATARAAQEEVATRNWVEWKKAERRIAELEGALRIAQKHVPKAYQARHEAGQPPPEWNTEDRRIVDAALAGTGVASDEARTASSPEVSEAMIEAGARWFAGLRDGEGIVSAHRYVETEPSDTDRAYARAVLTAARSGGRFTNARHAASGGHTRATAPVPAVFAKANHAHQSYTHR
jgi:hypothetical protein